MKSDKLLNFLLAFFLALIVFNLFMPKQNETKVSEDITLKALSASYALPNIPVLELDNTTDKDISFDTCKNLEISKDWAKITGLSNVKWFCKTFKASAKSKMNLDLNPISKMFLSTWSYAFKANISGKTYEAKTEIQEKWFFNSFFSSVFFAPVYNLLVFLIWSLPGHNLGLAIIVVTLIVRLIVLVPQHHILVNWRKMQSIQPKIRDIQEKYKWDQAKIGMELLELYKKEKVNPAGSCLPLLIQLPLLIVLYWTISWITSISNYYYLYWFQSDFDISKINPNFLWLNLIKQEWKSWLLLAILIWVSQWIQIKMSLSFQEKKKVKWKIVEKEVKVDDPISEFMPDPNVMNLFMLWWMPAMIAFSSYFFPSWVGIYWLIWTLFTLVQQYVVNHFFEKKTPITKDWHEIILSK